MNLVARLMNTQAILFVALLALLGAATAGYQLRPLSAGSAPSKEAAKLLAEEMIMLCGLEAGSCPPELLTDPNTQ